MPQDTLKLAIMNLQNLENMLDLIAANKLDQSCVLLFPSINGVEKIISKFRR